MPDRFTPELAALAETYDRAMQSSCATEAALLAGEFEGERIDIPMGGAVPDALRKAAAKALENGGAVRLKIQAFGGWVSKPQRHKPEFLESVAASGAGAPIMGREHEGWRKPPVEGVVESASYAGDGHALDADISLHGQDALRELSWGVMPRFSINPARTESTTATCSICEQPTGFGHAWKTDHWPGEMVDGKRVEIVWGGKGRLTEITRTYSPAADGTGIKAAALDSADDWLAQLSQQRRAAEALRGTTMADEKKPETKPAEPEAQASKTESDAAARVRQLEAQLAEREAKDAARDAQLSTLQAEHDRQLDERIHETIIGYARTGRLHKLANTADPKDPASGLNREKAIVKAMGLDAYRDHMDRVPANPALAAGIKSPTAGAPPGESEQQVGYAELSERMQALAAANPTATSDQIARMAQEALTAEGRIVTLH